MLPIIEKLLKTSEATESEIVELLNHKDASTLFTFAQHVTKQIFINTIHVRGIIEFSNYCRCNCYYCGIRNSNTSCQRFRLEVEDIIAIAKEGIEVGYKSIVLQAGEDPYYQVDDISRIIKAIKKVGDVGITLSFGEHPYEAYAQWKKDGADRYLLKHETANESLYNHYHPHSSFRKRLECLYQLKELGYQAGSGFMIGLPQQTTASIAQDILLLHELDVDMAGIGVFIPHPDTPLKDVASGDNLLAMKCVAISRILLKRTHLPITTSIKVNNVDSTFDPFMAGANVVMTKLEPYKYQKLYEIYPNKTVKDVPMKQARLELEKSINAFGKTISDTKGDAVTEYKL